MMLRNGKQTSYGNGIKRWITPGGVVDPGETEAEAVIREAGEEIGIKINVNDLVILLQKYDPLYSANMTFYTCTKWKGEIKLKEKEKFDKVSWVDLGEVYKLGEQPGYHLGVFMDEACRLAFDKEVLKSSKPNNVHLLW